MLEWAWWLEPNVTTNTGIYSQPECGDCPYSPYYSIDLFKDKPAIDNDPEQDKH